MCGREIGAIVLNILDTTEVTVICPRQLWAMAVLTASTPSRSFSAPVPGVSDLSPLLENGERDARSLEGHRSD